MRKAILAAALFAIGLTVAHAQPYPSRPITIIVPFAAGGPTDAIARSISDKMRVALGQPILVENVTGAGGSIGVSRAVLSVTVRTTAIEMPRESVAISAGSVP